MKIIQWLVRVTRDWGGGPNNRQERRRTKNQMRGW